MNRKSLDTINPYLKFLWHFYNRVFWDLHIESWISRKKIRRLKGKYNGEKAVIVCNGPSLLKSDLSLLTNVYSFGLNKINLLFDKSNFRPNCIVSVNPFVLEQNANFFNTTSIPLFIDSSSCKHIKRRSDTIFLHAGPSGFARDCSISLDQGYTVTYVALQLAFHMGFRQVALIGADHNFATKGPANKTVISGEKDESHFDDKYFSGGVPWQLPDLIESEISYLRAKKEFENIGGKVFNATEGGVLEVFERIKLEDFINL